MMTATRVRREVPPMRRLPLLMLTFLGALVTAPPAPAERIPRCTFDAGALPA